MGFRPQVGAGDCYTSVNALSLIALSGTPWPLAKFIAQHQPRGAYLEMAAEVRDIRRLRTSKALCLPSDLPLHLVCGSKDVIHS